ncbi:MAG: thymidine phosphorylase, partial [Candidatus Methanoperedens sp.]|nr:thymidine phosphorylase [Candidatus Methanoperedens sp.]
MELKIQPLQIKAGKHIVVLNSEDAKELGVRGGDRVQLKDHSYLTAIVETGDMIPKGSAGVYQEICEKLGKECPLRVDIVPTSRPNSISSIKKLMDKQKLSQEEIYAIVQDIVRDNLTEIELSAFVTASYIHGMSTDEIEWLTRAMIDTGEK